MNDYLLDKYNKYRAIARDGDIILTHSNKFVAKAIQAIDKAHWHHSEIVLWDRNRLMGFGAHPDEVGVSFLSHRFERKHWDDFTVIRPRFSEKEISEAIVRVYSIGEMYSHYDYGMIFKVLFYSVFGANTDFGSKKKMICSELTHDYLLFLGETIEKERPFFTPEDHLRYLGDNFKVII